MCLLLLAFSFLITSPWIHQLVPTPTSAAPETALLVNTTDDIDDGVCDAAHCSLREAISAANDRPGPDTITFDPTVFPSSGISVIEVTSSLPGIMDGGTTIDAAGANVTIYGGNPTSFDDIFEGLSIQSTRNTIRGIRIEGFPGVGIFVPSDDNTLIGVTVVNNGYGPPPFTGRDDGICIDVRGIGKSASRNRVINCTVKDNADDGIHLEARDGSRVEYNIIAGNIVRRNGEQGIELDAEGKGSSMSHNIVRSNRVEGNVATAIVIDGNYGATAHNNTVDSNTIRHKPPITEHEPHLFALSVEAFEGSADSNTLINNTVNSTHGISLWENVTNTLLYHNNFINNKRRAEDHGNNNRWDYDGEGNYWGDYDGEDKDQDGIGDTPHQIPPNGVDRYPLMAPFGTTMYEMTLSFRTSGGTPLDNATVSLRYPDGTEKTFTTSTKGYISLARMFSGRYEVKEVIWHGTLVDIQPTSILVNRSATCYFIIASPPTVTTTHHVVSTTATTVTETATTVASFRTTESLATVTTKTTTTTLPRESTTYLWTSMVLLVLVVVLLAAMLYIRQRK